MNRRPIALVLLLCLLAALLPRTAVAAEGAGSSIKLLKLSYPSAVKAGERVTFRVTADASAEGNLCCGRLTLKGPGKQYIYLELRQVAPDTLEASHTFSPFSPGGTWSIRSLTLRSNNWTRLALTEGEGFRHSFLLTNQGGTSDILGPEVRAVLLPQSAKVGEGFPITVRLTDRISGVREVFAVVEPRGGGGTAWRQSIPLRPTARSDEWTGYMVMDPPHQNNGGLTVAEVLAYDNAGNYTWLKRLDLLSRGMLAEVIPQPVAPPAGLITSPFLDLIHPGRMTYTHWWGLDLEHLLALLEQIPGESEVVRERLIAEIPQLRAALDQLRAEVYTDPTTGLRLSPFATTGKWFVLEKAIRLRTFLLSVTYFPPGQFSDANRRATANYFREAYTNLVDGDPPLPMDGAAAERYAGTIAAYLNLLAQSPEAVAVLKTAAYQTGRERGPSELDPGVIYFSPVKSQRLRPWPSQRGVFEIPALISESTYQTARDLFYRIGFHAGEVFLSPIGDRGRMEAWAPYVALREGHNWLPGRVEESPATNLGIDFASTYMPYGMDVNWDQSYRPLRDHPELKEAFRDLVSGWLENPPPPVHLSVGGSYQVGLEPSWKLTVSSPEIRAVLEVERELESGEPYEPIQLQGLRTGSGITFTSRHAQLGHPVIHRLRAVDRQGRSHSRYYSYLQVPLMLDPVPTGTNRETVTLTGTALPGKQVSVGARSAVADEQGRFSLEVPLEEGENHLRLTVSGSDLGARLVIHRAPAGAQVPLTVLVALPATTTAASVYGEMQTAPFAVVRMGDVEFQASETGWFWFRRQLESERNRVELVITDRYGNQVTWSRQVAREMPPAIEVEGVPEVTSLSTLTLTGRTDPGATLTLNGHPVSVGVDGSFEVKATLLRGQTSVLRFVARDSAGLTNERLFFVTHQE
ncbi:MAG: hypothetical protein ACOY93_08320 [Bacillota bacterium]